MKNKTLEWSKYGPYEGCLYTVDDDFYIEIIDSNCYIATHDPRDWEDDSFSDIKELGEYQTLEDAKAACENYYNSFVKQ